MEQDYIKKYLTQRELADYKKKKKKKKKRRHKIMVSPNTDLKKIMTLVYDNFPELFYVSRKYHIITGIGKKWIEINYIYSDSQITLLRNKIKEETGRFIQNHIEQSYTEYDKEKAVYDYLKNTVKYDFQEAFGTKLQECENAHNLVGAMIDKKCVCDGFAAAMKYLCNRIGVSCICVTGNAKNQFMSGPHAWNIVCIHGVYQHVDVTWDNQNLINSDIDNYVYFNVDDQYMGREHRWNRECYPSCESAPYNYFKVNDAIISSERHLLKFIQEHLDNGEETILFRIGDERREADYLFDHLQNIIQKALSLTRYAKVKAFQYSYYEEHKIISIKPEYR